MKRFDVLYQIIKDISIGKLLYNYYLREMPAGWTMTKPHTHNAIEIICCVNGAFKVWVKSEGNVVSVKKSECIIIQQGLLHRLFLDEKSDALCACVSINKEFIEQGIGDTPYMEDQYNIFKSRCSRGKGFLKLLDDNMISDCIIRIIKEANGKEEDWEETIKFEMICLFIRIYKNIKKQYQIITDKNNEHIFRAMSYIYENLLNPITPKDIADHTHISSNHLMHMFKACTGKPIMDTIMEIRANRGKNLLENTTLSVSEIAYQCGYSSLQHFSMHFKKTFGETPSAYRKKVSEIDLLHSR